MKRVLIRRVEACFFLRIQGRGFRGVPTGRFYYAFFVHARDRSPVRFEEAEFKQREEAQRHFPVPLAGHPGKARVWWWFRNEFYTAPPETGREDIEAYAAPAPPNVRFHPRSRPPSRVELRCAGPECHQAGEIKRPAEPITVRCPRCAARMVVWWSKSAQHLEAKPLTESPTETGPARNPWKILGLERDATAQEIQSAFRQSMKDYHPDRVAHLGPELRALAEKKSKEINWAYEKLRAA